MTRVAVARGTRARGFDGVREKVELAYEVLELGEALQREYRTDAHLVTYVVRGARRQPRINKPGLPSFPQPVEVGVFFCDVDNPDHAPWTPETLGEALVQYDNLAVLQTAGVYHTAHGRRIVQPLAEPIPAGEVEPYIRRWFRHLEDAGLAVDWQCRDWTRHYRLPHVFRDGRRYRSPYVQLERMRPIALEPLPAEPDAPDERPAHPKTAGLHPAHPGATPLRPAAVDWTTELPSFWQPRVQALAAAVRSVQSEWHSLFLALAGALLSRRVPPEHVPAICRAVSLATGADDRTDDREAGARSTVQRWLAGQPATGYAQLSLRWPDVALTLDEATASGMDAEMRALAAIPTPEMTLSLEETTAALREVIRTAPPGVTLVAAECGLGKTQAAIQVATERAARQHASPDAASMRAPLQSKTSISVDKNALAEQVQSYFGVAGVPAKRIFGPLSVLQADGTPECRFHDVAEPLVAGGQSMQRELCEGRGLLRCEQYEHCTARLGYMGPDDARVTIGSHALVAALDQAAGSTGLLVIDEPPPLLETTTITLEDLEVTESTLSAFHRDYTEAMRPALQAVRSWVETATEEQGALVLKDGVRAFAAAVDPGCLLRAQLATETNGDAVDCAVAAPLLDKRSQAPPLRQTELSQLRYTPARARQVGRASGVLDTIYHALTAPWLVVGHAGEQVGQPVLQITAARRDLTRALRRDGAVVVMDANIGVHAEIYEKALGYRPPLHQFHARDGAPIDRTHLWCSEASRAHWMRNGKLTPKPSLVNAVREVVRWAREDPAATRLGLITLKPIRLALDAILHPEDPAAAAAWKEAQQLDGTLAKLRASLAPILALWPGEIRLGHYGAMRGLDTMADVDCLATLGDPWPNIGMVEHDMDYLGLPDEAEARKLALCRAELEQAHGRLRTVHRERPGRALHVGRILPGGSGWCGGQARRTQLKRGRPGPDEPMTVEELEAIIVRLGSVSAAARMAGCSAAYLRQCRTGSRPISQKIVGVLRSVPD